MRSRLVVEEKIEPKQEEPAPKEEEEIVKIDAPEISSSRVIDKIDLSAIDSSTRPKKVIKKKADQEAETPAAEEKLEEKEKPARSETPKKGPEEKEEKKKAKETEELTEIKEESVTEDDAAVITNIKAEKIEGPRILGKIDLPVSNDTRPVKDETSQTQTHSYREKRSKT